MICKGLSCHLQSSVIHTTPKKTYFFQLIPVNHMNFVLLFRNVKVKLQGIYIFYFWYLTCTLTNRNSSMWTTKINIWLRYGSHANLIVSTREETSKRRDEWYGASPCLTSNSHADQVLFCDVALNKSVWESILPQIKKNVWFIHNNDYLI